VRSTESIRQALRDQTSMEFDEPPEAMRLASDLRIRPTDLGLGKTDLFPITPLSPSHSPRVFPGNRSNSPEHDRCI
jgi:hypothetical protein